jgi:NitT/TauT family transport system permease protein
VTMNWRNNQLRFIVPLILLVAWEGLSRMGFISSSLLPPPSKVILVWIDWIFGTTGTSDTNSGKWLNAAVSSGTRVLAGFAIASISAIVIGIAIGWWKIVEKMIEPTLQILRPIPPVSWVPLAIMWFGIANKPAIFLVFLGSFFPILMNTIHGVKNSDKNLIRAASMMGATQWQMVRYVVFPASLPNIFAGLRIGIGSAWMLSVTSEMVAVKSGLGYVLWDSYYFMRYDLVIASMASIGLLGYISDFLLKKLMDRILHYQKNMSVQGLEN